MFWNSYFLNGINDFSFYWGTLIVLLNSRYVHNLGKKYAMIIIAVLKMNSFSNSYN